MKNLSTEHPIDKHLKPVKDSDGNNSALEISTEKVRVKDLEVTGDTIGVSASDSTKLPLSGGAMTGAITTNSTFDGVDIATRDAILTSTTTTANASLPKAGGTMTGNVDFGDQRLTNLQRVAFNDGSGYITELIDNDDMSSATSTKVSTSESVKAYVDNNSHIKVATVTLDESDMNALHTTKIDIVPAQGANKVIIPTSGMLFIDRDSSTAQSSGTANFFIGYNGTSSLSETIYYIRRFMYNESGDRVWHLQHYQGEAGNTLTDGDNVPLTVKLDNAITSGSIDSMKISVSYYVFDNS